MRLIQAAEILIDKIKKEYKDDVAVVVMMGSHLYGETHSLSDLDMYFVVNTPRGYELGKTFIIDGIGFDFWPISWERMTRIANHDERITAIITEGQVLYYGSDADLARFNTLKTLALDVSEPKKFIDKAQNVLKNAYKPYFELQSAQTLAQARKLGTQIVFAVTNALALINKDTVKRGRGKLKAELLAMPLIPDAFETHYDVLFESDAIEAIQSAMQALIKNTAVLIASESARYASEHPENAQEKLSGFYEELINFYNKITHGIAVSDYVTVFYAANEIVLELEDVFSGTGVSLETLPDIIGSFNLNDMARYAKTVINHQVALETLLAGLGVSITTFKDFEALKASMA